MRALQTGLREVAALPAPTAAALAVQQLQRWLDGASIRSCGQGPAIGLPDSVWQCAFTVASGAQTFDAAIRWSHHGSHATRAPPDGAAVHRLDGTSAPIVGGEPIVATERPVLIQYRHQPAPAREPRQ